jgi:hypothetical protein
MWLDNERTFKRTYKYISPPVITHRLLITYCRDDAITIKEYYFKIFFTHVGLIEFSQQYMAWEMVLTPLTPDLCWRHHLHPDMSRRHHLLPLPDLTRRHYLHPDLSWQNHLFSDLSRRHHLLPDLSIRHYLLPDLSRRHHLLPDLSIRHHLLPDFEQTTSSTPRLEYTTSSAPRLEQTTSSTPQHELTTLSAPRFQYNRRHLLLLRSLWSYRAFLSIFCISPQFITPYRPGNSDFGLFACRNVGCHLGLLA